MEPIDLPVPPLRRAPLHCAEPIRANHRRQKIECQPSTDATEFAVTTLGVKIRQSGRRSNTWIAVVVFMPAS